MRRGLLLVILLGSAFIDMREHKIPNWWILAGFFTGLALAALEAETGVVLSNSPTVNVGYEAVEELPKEAHESPMLSLSKTKSREELRDWLQEGIFSGYLCILRCCFRFSYFGW